MLQMSAGRLKPLADRKKKASVSQDKEHRPFRTSKVLAERSQAVVAVGAWVERGEDLPQHPCSLALFTEKLQAERRRENEERLRRFHDEVRHRVTQQTQVYKKRQQGHTPPVVTPDRRTQHYQVRTRHISAAEKQTSEKTPLQQRSPLESRECVRHVRLRLAACRVIQNEEMATSDLPGSRWNVSPTRHNAECHVLTAVEGVLGESNQEKEEDPLFTSPHICPLLQQKVGEHALLDPDELNPDPVSKSSYSVPRVLWPLSEKEELKKQRQSQFLMHRRLVMKMERAQVKENKQYRKHLKRTSRIKAEKEQICMEEERWLERAQQIEEARKKLEERELLILEQLKLEEEEERAAQLQRRKPDERGKETTRFVEALRAQMKERLSKTKVEPPPLCFCASSFWDSHPNTCANNCVFHNNPKAYAQALHSTMASLDLR